MIHRLPSVALLLLAIAAACAPMWWIYRTPQLIVVVTVALVLGAGLATLGVVRGWRGLTLLLVGVGALVALAVPLTAPHAIPRGDWLTALPEVLAGVVLSWRRLLTVGLPVGNGDALLMAPLVLVLAGSLLGVRMALRSRSAELAAAIPTGIGIWSILWGPPDLPVPWVLAMLVLVPTVAYVAAVRQLRRRSRSPRALSSFARRVGAGTLVAVLAAVAAGAAGALVPLPERVVLRGDPLVSEVVRDATPLAEHRSFWQPAERTATQLVATGLVAGDRIRLAALDRYDGSVLGVAAGDFLRVPSGEEGEGRLVGITIESLRTRWLPIVGEPTAIRFVGEHAEPLASGLHRDAGLRSALTAAPLDAGDGYRMLVRASDALVAGDAIRVLEPADAAQTPAELPEPMLAALASWSGDAIEPGARLAGMVEGLRATGYVSHGVGADEPRSRPGHSLERLERLFREPMVGDAEQYSVAAMLLARQLGFDARVVVGFAPEVVEGGVTRVVGADAAAWLEVRTVDGWVGIDVLPDERPVPEEEEGAPVVVQQPPAQHAPAPEPRGQEGGADPAGPIAPERDGREESRLLAVLGAVGAVGGLAALIAAIPVGLVVAKVVRKRRRRADEDARARAEGAWAELEDAMVDRGAPLRAGGTRLEQAEGAPHALALAALVDRAVFALAPPTDAEIDAAWRASDASIAERDRERSWWQRALARLSPASLVRR